MQNYSQYDAIAAEAAATDISSQARVCGRLCDILLNRALSYSMTSHFRRIVFWPDFGTTLV